VPTVESDFTSVVEVGFPVGQSRWWHTEGGAIQRVLAEHYGAEVAGHALSPSVDPNRLRAELRLAAPELTELTDRVRAAFDRRRACAVLVPRLEVAELDTDDKRKAVFAFASLIGDPTANLPFEQVLWDVCNNSETATRHTSFSENDREADYHTDNGALRVPERFFLLYAVRAASCGGGVSMIRDGRVLIEQLRQTPGGRATVELLTEAVVPRRVPKAFQAYADVASDGYKYTPILARSEAEPPLWRWRKDRVYQGLAKYPRYATPELCRAVDLVADLLEHGADQVRQTIPTDGLLVVNNHIALHGRTAFTDQRRHLFRLRFHEPAADPQARGSTG
jgi:alpha-ketoglutarate-dependent taurine dioxygenase